MTDAPIERVHYHFTVVGTPDDAWRVRRMELTEAIARPYQLILTVFCAAETLDIPALLGSDAELSIRRGDAARTVAGVVRRVVELGAIRDGRIEFELTIVPAIALGEQRVDTRIFQDMAVPDIVLSVLGGVASGLQRGCKGSYTRAHAPREFCVQYRESDLAFVRRLLEEEGLLYVFDQREGEPEHVHVIDDVSALPSYENVDGTDELSMGSTAHDLGTSESIARFAWASSLQPNGVVRSDYDPSNPAAPVVHELRLDDPRGGARELYRHGARRWESDDGARDAELELRGLDPQRRGGRGNSNAVGLAAGTTFTLAGDGDGAGTRMVVTRIVHRGDNPDVDLDAHAGGLGYTNDFECVPAEAPLVLPRTTPKPVVHGSETATVTGYPGEEIYTDEQGRVRVRFHWDRSDRTDGTSSCWLRVAQAWAGNGFGAMVIPRVGMEVVVGFFAGNPDRPYVAGCMYNGTHTVPHALPESRTKTTLRSQSSPGGDGFNELSFEDAAGHEQVFVHAQRDLDAKIERNETAAVGSDRTVAIGRHDTLTVGGDQKITVDGNQTLTVGGGGKQGTKGTEVAIKGVCNIKVTDPGEVLIDAVSKITLRCGASSLVIDPNSIKLFAGSGARTNLDTNVFSQSSLGALTELADAVTVKSMHGTTIALDGKADIAAANGGSMVLDSAVKLAAVGLGRLTLDADAALAGTKVSVDAAQGSSLALDAGAKLDGKTGTRCSGPGGTVECAETGVTVEGAIVEVLAATKAAITAALTTLNS